MRALTVDLDNTLIDFMRMKRIAAGAAAAAMVRTGLRMREERARHELFRISTSRSTRTAGAFELPLERRWRREADGGAVIRRVSHAERVRA